VTPPRIFLIGLSGAGKTTTGRLLAARLGWDFVDSDEAIEAETGRAVPEIFASDGEAAFRALEARTLDRLTRRERIVVATGGGAPTDPASRRALSRGFVVWLSVSPESSARRLQSDPAAPPRPLLRGDPEARLGSLLQQRISLYRQADAAVDVDAISPEQAAAEVQQLWEEWSTRPSKPAERFFAEAAGGDGAAVSDGVAAIVQTPLSRYPVIVLEGALARLGGVCRDAGLLGRAFIVTDDAVGPLFAARAEDALLAAGYRPLVLAIPAGEQHKTLNTVQLIYDWLLGERVERSDFVVCLGGGVVTDVAGFAAATCLRGIDFVHVPTSLLAMADAAIGGKTGVDHSRGKNLIGAFAQPRAVVIDPLLLRSLPVRHLRNGWAEVIKHGFILDEPLTRDLEAVASDPGAMFSPALIARSVAIKAAVVSEDEREAGRRTLLNYGHTVGHAIETVTGFSTVLHGEAVAVGMHAAGLIARDLGLLASAELERQQGLIRAAGLPERAPGLSAEAILEAMLSDKKVRDGRPRFVLLDRIGHAVTRDDVPDAVVRLAVETVVA